MEASKEAIIQAHAKSIRLSDKEQRLLVLIYNCFKHRDRVKIECTVINAIIKHISFYNMDELNETIDSSSDEETFDIYCSLENKLFIHDKDSAGLTFGIRYLSSMKIQNGVGEIVVTDSFMPLMENYIRDMVDIELLLL